MGYVTPTQPNLTDYLYFLASSAQIPTAALPQTSPYLQFTLDWAKGLVINPPGCVLPAPATPTTPSLYVFACYNCATHLLLQFTPDQQGQNFFANARSASGFGLIQPSTGIVMSASDQGTSGNVAEPEWAKGLTVDELGFFKTPYGRVYLAWNQSFGPTIVGLT